MRNIDEEDAGIAVIGMAGRFPGANNLRQFWDNLLEGKDTISHFSDEDLRKENISEDLINNPHYVKSRGILDDVDKFDGAFFGITPYEASITDPQHRLFLEVCWEALEISGYALNTNKFPIGVFAGVSDGSYLTDNLQKNEDFKNSNDGYQTALATSSQFLATKVSYHLNLTGPSVTVNTACSTSLVAIIQACQSLYLGDSEIALAGGVSIKVPQISGYLFKEGSILSSDGKCRAFDKNSSGTVMSNGIGVVVLKRLQDAIRDGDNIDAIIRGYAINNDGSTKAGYSAPSVLEQSRCIATAMMDLDAETISYVETHGTGTIIGDPIEVAALTQAFRHFTTKTQFCALGSIKANIGHTDVAAGVAGFIKTVLALKNKILPATLHFEEANPHLKLDNSPFYINHQSSQWHTEYALRRAGVSSFGVGGTNAHVILEEAQKSLSSISISKNYHLIILSAKTITALKTQGEALSNHLEQHPHLSLADVAYTLQEGRAAMTYRGAVVCQTIKEAIVFLRHPDFMAGTTLPVGGLGEDANHLLKVAKLWCDGEQIDWQAINNTGRCQRVQLPTYPFERIRYWIEPTIGNLLEKNFLSSQPTIYAPYWEVTNNLAVQSLRQRDTWIVFVDSFGIADKLISLLLKDSHGIIQVTPGNTYNVLDSNKYEINPSEKKDYQKLYSALLDNNLYPTHVLHCWSYSANVEIVDEITIEKRFQFTGFLSLTYFTQAFLIPSQGNVVNITIITNHLKSVEPDDVIVPEKATLIGACLVIPQEYKALCQLIDVDEYNKNDVQSKSLFNRVLIDLYHPPTDSVIVYRRGFRLVQRFKRYDNSSQILISHLRQGDTYLITGGLGQIGLLLAEYLAKKYAAKIILISRRDIPKESTWENLLDSSTNKYLVNIIKTLIEIRKYSQSFEFIQADITNYEEMKTHFDKIQKQYKKLDTVFHLAGVADNSAKILIQDLNEDELFRLLQPKIQGVKVLRHLIDSMPVNSCILYSSLASLAGGIGLSAYAASNCFLDSYCEKHSNKTNFLSLNWDTWNLKANLYDPVSKNKVGKATIVPFQAMEVLEKYCGQINIHHQLAISIYPLGEKIKNNVNVNKQNTVMSGNEFSLDSYGDTTNIIIILEEIFRKCLGQNEINLNQSFYDMGGDSISAIHLLQRIEKSFGVRIKLADLIKYNSVTELAKFIFEFQELAV